MQTTELHAQDLYLRHTGGDGKSYIVEHRVWNAELFLTACQAACNKVNEKENDPRKRQASVTLVSREQYQKERDHGKH